ncbi:NfeD family protein [Spongiibacter sp. KMU-158]|uniref:NfeD family protein n=1 Tax=Spongiibacter pelagi TaxID=2760804 RepID=A0A927C0S0_9GAMM|nr:NfeD family protein [Spongiibacter pelagi]MBD2859139.1 NfeD family protein [Spongiibacter pelagi]
MDWLNTHIAYWHWLVFGLLLVITEIFVPSFVMIWFGASAVAVGLILAVIEMPVSVQLLIWAALSVFDLFIWFKFVHPKMKDRSLSGMSREQLIGQEGMVIKVGQDGHGTMRFPVPVLGNDEWSFICRGMVSVGDKVYVEELSGNSVIVKVQQPRGE